MENNQITIFVNGRKRKAKNGNEFIAYRTMMKLIVEGEEDKGYQNVWVDVSFARDITPIVDKLKGRIAVTLLNTKLNAPQVYRVTKEMKPDGTWRNKYPKVYINEVIEVKEAPREVPQSQFATDPNEVAIRKPHLQPRKKGGEEVEEETDF